MEMSGVVDSQMMADQNNHYDDANHYGDAMQYMEDANVNEQ